MPQRWDIFFYFLSEGRHTEDFPDTRKIQRLRLGLNPRTRVPVASMLTTRPPKPSSYCETKTRPREEKKCEDKLKKDTICRRIPSGSWMSLVSVACCQAKVSALGHSSRGVLPSMVCLWSWSFDNEDVLAKYGLFRQEKKVSECPGCTLCHFTKHQN